MIVWLTANELPDGPWTPLFKLKLPPTPSFMISLTVTLVRLIWPVFLTLMV